jgi:hypothetical protein
MGSGFVDDRPARPVTTTTAHSWRLAYTFPPSHASDDLTRDFTSEDDALAAVDAWKVARQTGQGLFIDTKTRVLEHLTSCVSVDAAQAWRVQVNKLGY